MAFIDSKSLFREAINSCDLSLPHKILYDTLLYKEWRNEPDILNSKDSIDQFCTKRWSWLGFLKLSQNIPQEFPRLAHQQSPWHIAIRQSGELLAMIQNEIIEIRSSKDKYSSLISINRISKEDFPQWRRVCWSPDMSMIALAYSNGSVDLLDSSGCRLFTIIQETSSKLESKVCFDWSLAIADVIFIDVKNKKNEWCYELLVIEYSGILRSYYINKDIYIEKHSFSFENVCPHGVTRAAYLPSHHILIVGAPLLPYTASPNISGPHQMGLSSWRVLSDYPYYKMVTSLDEELNLSTKPSYLERIPFLRAHSNKSVDFIFTMSVSPNEKYLAASHTSGKLTVWHLPSLRPYKIWALNEQSLPTSINPLVETSHVYNPFHINSLEWWSDKELILTRQNGSVAVCSISSLENLLGSSTAWFHPGTKSSESFNGQFLLLECESKLFTKSLLNLRQKVLASKLENQPIVNKSFKRLIGLPVLFRFMETLKVVLYYFTDNEKFQPLEKKAKINTRDFRLLGIKSTSPQELFLRLLDEKRYQEALLLASTYHLDSDIVYQRQWRSSPISLHSISEYLMKITKRLWVIEECIDRVPDSFTACQGLLLFGLNACSIEALVILGKDSTSDLGSSEYNLEDLSESSLKEKLQIIMSSQNKKLLNQLKMNNLNNEQKKLILIRQKLVFYLDKLSIYEELYEDTTCFNKELFKELRDLSWLDTSLYFSYRSNALALKKVLSQQPHKILPHLLTILFNFPETTSPQQYEALLPRITNSGKLQIISLEFDMLPYRVEDWCKGLDIKTNCFNPDDVSSFYSNNRLYQKYNNIKLTEACVCQWYKDRISEIFNRTNLIENCMELLQIGRKNNIKGLESFTKDFQTLDTLIFECNCQHLPETFEDFQHLNHLQKIQLFMQEGSLETFIPNLRQWVLPYIMREDIPHLLEEFLQHLAPLQLEKCFLIFEESKGLQPIIKSKEKLVTIALNCIYLCQRNDQLEIVHKIVECLPEPDSELTISQEFQDKLEHLEKQLQLAEFCAYYEIFYPIVHFQVIENDMEKALQLLKKLSRSFFQYPHSVIGDEWPQFLNQVYSYQSLLLKRLSISDCSQVIVEGLLRVGISSLIDESKHILELNSHGEVPKKEISSNKFEKLIKLPYDQSYQILLQAAQEYFNSAANLNDPCMELAKQCLKLIETPDEQILKELDLIESLDLLQQFKVEILPLQLRLCKDKLEVVNKVIYSLPHPVKHLSNLLKLSKLLHINEESNNEEQLGCIMTLVARMAFKGQDYEGCFNTCNDIINKDLKEGWKICLELGTCDNFDNLEGRVKLLTFVLAYCEDKLLPKILKSKAELEMMVIATDVNFYFQTKEGEQSSPIEKEKEVLIKETILSMAAKTIISSIEATSEIVKSAVSNPLQPIWKSEDTIEQLLTNKELELPALPSFSISENENQFHCSQLDFDYKHFSNPSIPPLYELGLSILQASFMKSAVINSPLEITPKLIHDIAQKFISQDLSFAFSLLLSLKKVEDIKEFFDSLPANNIFVNQIAIYFICIRLYSDYDPKIDIRSLSPTDAYNKVSDLLQTSSIPSSEPYVELLESYKKSLHDEHQYIMLLTKGVDFERFVTDPSYKQETIIGLAMSEETFKFSTTLAQRYNVDLWDLFMCRLESLFSDPSVYSEELESKLEPLMETLVKKPSKLQSHLQNNILPTLIGTDYNKLSMYYSLVEPLPQTFIDLLSLVSNLKEGVNFLHLIDSKDALVELMNEKLDEHNVAIWVGVFTELEHLELTSDMVYLARANICFWSSFSVEHSAEDYVERFERCDKLALVHVTSPANWYHFLQDITLSKRAVSEIPLQARILMLEKALLLITEEKLQICDTKVEWESVLQNIQVRLTYLIQVNKFKTKTEIIPEIHQHYSELELNQGEDQEKFTQLYIKFVLSGITDPEILDSLLAALPSSPTIKSMNENCLGYLKEKIVTCLSTDSISILIQTLETFLERLKKFSSPNYPEVDNISKCLSAVLTSPILNKSDQEEILLILKRLDLGSEFEDQTQHLWLTHKLRALWPNSETLKSATSDTFKNGQARRALLSSLIEDDLEWAQCVALVEVCSTWPEESEDLYVELLETCLRVNQDETINTIIPTSITHFSSQGFASTFKLVQACCSFVEVLKVALMSPEKEYQQTALETLSNSQDDNSQLFDVYTLEQLVVKDLLLPIIKSPAFNILVRSVLTADSLELVKSVVQVLLHEQMEFEADSLAALYKNVHPALLTLQGIKGFARKSLGLI